MESNELAPLGAVYATRRANLRALAEANGGLKKLGARLGYSSAYMTQLTALGGGVQLRRNITERTARAIETKMTLTFGWLDMQRAA